MDTEIKSKRPKLNVFFYYTAVFLMPSILLFYLYNNNRVQNRIYFEHILLLAGIFAIVGLLIYMLLKFISKTAEGALLLSICFWLFFWFFRDLYSVTVHYAPVITQAGFVIILCSGIIFAALLLLYHKPRLIKLHSVFLALSVSLVLMFIFNFIPGVSFNIMLYRARAENEDRGNEALSALIKQDFILDKGLPKPDIYWVHMDGMMSLETVEHHWGELQDYVREALVQREFVIYSNSILYGGYTFASSAALFSPAFYDSFLNKHLADVKMELREDKNEYIVGKLAQIGLTIDDVILSYELFEALAIVGYEIEIIGDTYDVFLRRKEQSEDYLTDDWSIAKFGALPELLALTTPLNSQSTSQGEVSGIFHLIGGARHTPRFTLMMISDAHAGSFYLYEPDMSWHDGLSAVHIYPFAHKQAVHSMFDYVDNIFAVNPNAVIILQSDHGFHSGVTQRHLLDTGYELDEVLELNHSVFSATYIPAKYGGVSEPIAPLNISRVLVNRFVGENYILLDN
ncbi:MAG: hypothetical protein FWD44_01775 [Oscillospiraceae bacterium]|nr:hypothetical protein [Oscillospiraceae bacterium]